MNHNSLKKELDEIILISNDFLKSKLAKELVLKDDEKTPKPINEKITKEIEEHLDIKVKFVNDLNLESLPVEMFSEDYKMNVLSSKSNVDELKRDVNMHFNFSVFDVLKIINTGKSYELIYTVNKKYNDEIFIVYILATEIENPRKRIMIGDLKGGVKLYSGINLDLPVSIPYSFIVVTNTGKQINLK
jgi:hypothetical protein